jgi:MFS family permease
MTYSAIGAMGARKNGRRRMFVVGLLLFSAASLAGGLATSAAWLLAARAVQGAGAVIAVAGFDRAFLVAAAIAVLTLVVAITTIRLRRADLAGE